MVERMGFGSAPDGRAVSVFVLTRGGVRVRVMDFGATILGIEVPDASGAMGDVVLGFDTLDGYLDNPACFGATIGPSANRMAGAAVAVDGELWQLERNEGPNNLHSSMANGLHKRVWDADAIGEGDDAFVRMTCTLGHGELGLPGVRVFTAEFRLDSAGALEVRYACESDRRTYVNMTNHTYFNLAGAGSGTVAGQRVCIDADAYLPIDAASIPTGEIRSVEGTPFDLREPKPFSFGLDAVSDEQIALARGYDHCFCVRDYWSCGHLRHALRAEDPVSGRALDVQITAPGVQLYTGNWLEDRGAKGGADYGPASGFAVEPEHYPDTPNHAAFPQSFCGPGHPYESVIRYEFSVMG